MPPSQGSNFVGKSIGVNPTTPNITNYASTIRIRWVKKRSGKKFGTQSGSHLGAIFATHPSRIRTCFGKNFFDLRIRPHISIVDAPFRWLNDVRFVRKWIDRILRGSECVFLARFWRFPERVCVIWAQATFRGEKYQNTSQKSLIL